MEGWFDWKADDCGELCTVAGTDCRSRVVSGSEIGTIPGSMFVSGSTTLWGVVEVAASILLAGVFSPADPQSS